MTLKIKLISVNVATFFVLT